MYCRFILSAIVVFVFSIQGFAADEHKHDHDHEGHVHFSIQSAKSGKWSEPATWKPARVPKHGDRVLVSRETFVEYDVKSEDAIRLLQVVGTLSFARDRDTELNVGVLKIQNSDTCTESGFACDFHNVTAGGEPIVVPESKLPALLVGTATDPIPAKYTAKIRLHFFEGMNEKDAPAIACCSARLEIHGSPLTRTWTKLAADAEAGSKVVVAQDELTGWRVGDEVIVTATERGEAGGSYRRNPDNANTELRKITAIDGQQITLDQPLKSTHLGSGEFRGEVANLSRNVVIESADPDGVRGHTVYHRFSRGGVSYARFAHLGKEGVLGRYALHFHLVGDTMRGGGVLGAAIVDSHNRWITIHGTNYLVVRDCIGYKSVGHGFFMEDGSEIYNLLDRNLGVHAYSGKRLPNQVLPFDPNDGAAFWWSNGRNTITRNITCENDEYGYRYDMQHSRYFDSTLPIVQPDGSEKKVDVRTIPIWRFDNNEAHAEGFYGMVVAANGNSQPDTAITNQKQLEFFKNFDWTGPDVQHPHMISNLSIWGAHYAFRPHSPSMRMENVRLHDAAYGVYRPAFENHEYVNLTISKMGSEPFNRGMDDASAQTGKISVDGLTFTSGYGNKSTPLVQISDVDINGDAETHIRNVKVNRPEQFRDRWPLFNRGGGPQVTPITDGVPIFVHDYFGPGRHAKVVSVAAKDLINDGNKYKSEETLTGSEARVAEVSDVEWPEILSPVDDLPPATIITQATSKNGNTFVRGVTHDNGEVTQVTVNGKSASLTATSAGVTDWQIELTGTPKKILAFAKDDSGNVEQTQHNYLR
ncbi:MAG: hypothetical protein ACI9HK_004715 [Pirellulaceae bacterium]|jgi:hypothetical protein